MEESNPCDDCGKFFLLRQGSGQCPKCVKLQPHALDSAEYSEIQKWPQCCACGIARRNMPLSANSIQTCGSLLCTNSTSGTPADGTAVPLGPSLVANAAFETNQHRSALMKDRMTKFQATKSVITPGTLLTTAVLQDHENGGGAPGEPKVWVCWQVRLSTHPKAIASGLGFHTKGWAVSKFMPDIKVEIVKDFGSGTNTMSLNEFYTYYSTPSNAPIYLQGIPSQWKGFERTRGAKRFVCMELFVHVDKWEERVSEQETESTRTSSRKRTRALSSSSTMGSKQLRLSGRWTTKLVEEEIVHGKIFDEPFSSGTMKHAHDLILANGDQFVAKHFVQLSSDACEYVSIKANRIEIEGELLHLAWARWFLNEFYQFCRKQGEISVDETLSVADAFLAEEVGMPSIASGVEIITGNGTGITWLVERKRPMTVTKYSGTLVNTSARRDLRSLTICAFAHFVYGFSDRSLVLADLQAQVRGTDGLVLFDLMTHTVDGMKRDSGIGDFGKQGIRTFTRDHQCNSICSGLGFDTQYSLAIGTSRESGELNNDNSDDDHDNDKDEEDEEDVQNQAQPEKSDNNSH
ncbi:kinase-like domain-containing protein [Mycena leptocephala]|nr:kinase-like domain-containing protein [Mycena leptocephala]